jgi:2-octaprenyl-6-methoxyphenol hydroxylase
MILVRGAGPVGCATALALCGGRHPVALLRAPSASPALPQLRSQPLALSYASRLILERIGVWSRLETTPIETIVVSQAQAFGEARLDARDAQVPALGYVSDYPALAATLLEAVVDRGVALVESADAAGNAPLLTVHAEGQADDAAEKPYRQHALIADVAVEPAAGSTAFERFTAQGPLALLPLGGRYGVVWSTSPQRAQALLALGERDFLVELSQAAGPRAGRLVAVSVRSALPLVLRVRRASSAEREVHVGNAAQALHPVAGQGLNLGLRDAWELADLLSRCDDPGAGETLRRYARRRRFDRAATIAATDSLARLFLGAHPALRSARGIALSALDLVPPARRFFARRMIFGASALP